MPDLSKVKIIFSDIDGTLLPWSGKDLSGTAALLDRLMKAGYVFVPCTGRGTENIPEAIRSLPGIRYAVTANGAIVTDIKSGQAVYRRLIHRHLAKEITAYLRPYNGNAYLYRHGLHYLDNKLGMKTTGDATNSLKVWFREAGKVDFDKFLAEEESEWIDKMGFSTQDQTARQTILREIRQQPFINEIEPTSSGIWNVEINAAGVSKGNAALWLCEQLGYDPSEMLTAGDNYNDLPMLTAGGISLAPLNAEPEVRAAATYVVPDCRDDGVENFLKQLLDEQ